MKFRPPSPHQPIFVILGPIVVSLGPIFVILGLDPRIALRTYLTQFGRTPMRRQMLGSSPSMTAEGVNAARPGHDVRRDTP